MKKPVRFIITIFGNKHVGMLVTDIYSILQSNPGSPIAVFWQDIDKRYIEPVMSGFKTVTFTKTNFDFASDPVKRIASKTLLWNYAAKTYHPDKICLLDVDTLVIKNIYHLFDQDFDIIFTYKDGRWPLNTGVLLCKGEKYPLFFQKWVEDTTEIINDRESSAKANSLEYPYGAADQMSLFDLLCYNHNQTEYTPRIAGQNLTFVGVPCEILNEVHSKAIADSTHIIHYKGGWQNILLEGQNFTKYRTKAVSWEMYILYLKTFMKSIEYINNNTNIRYQPEDFGVVIPGYVDTSTFKENRFLYFLYACRSRIESLIDRRFNMKRLRA